MKKEKHSGWKNFVKALGLPEQAITQQNHLELTGQNELIIDNAKGILDYDPEYIKLILVDGYLVIRGSSLHVDMFMERTIIIRGRILSLEFE